MPDLLRAEKISKSYGGVFALRRANFFLRAGEVHALMGENGAGKSTLIKILAGAAKPEAGKILVDEQPVTINNPLDSQRLGFGIIYQELRSFSESDGRRKYRYSQFQLSRGLDRQSTARSIPFAGLFSIKSVFKATLGRSAASLPIGQLQLMALARALSMNARMILMDEPTSALAADGVTRLLALVRKLRDRWDFSRLCFAQNG